MVSDSNLARWACADERRKGWHCLHEIARYSVGFRAARVLVLKKRMDLRIAELDLVKHLTSLPWFSAMVVLQGQHITYERYAADFGPLSPHSVQSISKTFVNLIVGRLLDEGLLDLSKRVADYVPEMGTGYAAATLQQVLDMDVANDYSENFSDPNSTYFAHEEAMGWRLPRNSDQEETEHGFISRITGADLTNYSGIAQYKDANSAVLGWVVERASGRPLRTFLAEIADAAGLESVLHITTDRLGVPTIEGGACLTVRDLARYFSLFVRGGRGVDGRTVGSESFIAKSLTGGLAMSAPYEGIRYSNHLMVRGKTVGHGGWGGQYVLANFDTGKVGVFLSVIENEHATNRDYIEPVIRMLEMVTSRA